MTCARYQLARGVRSRYAGCGGAHHNMRKLSAAQEFALKRLAHDMWYPGCGWYWGNTNTTIRITESLLRRGLIAKRTLKTDTGEYEAYMLRVAAVGKALTPLGPAGEG